MTLKIQIGELPDDMLAQGDQPSSEPSALGLVVAPLRDTTRERFDLDSGVVVVRSEGPARAAGIRERDIVTRLQNRTVDSVSRFHEIANSLPKGRNVPVFIVRGGRPLILALKVPE